LRSASMGSLEIEFKGHFCRTCGFYDYFDDFSLELGNVGIRNKIEEVKETDGGAIVRFLIL
jgi:hypothetical protein